MICDGDKEWIEETLESHPELRCESVITGSHDVELPAQRRPRLVASTDRSDVENDDDE